MSDFLPLLFLTTLGSFAGLLGGIVFLFVTPWSKLLARYSIPFAAGIFLSASLIGVLPEAIELAGVDILLTVLLAFLAAYLLETFVVDVHHHDDRGHTHAHTSSTKLIVIGDTIHNLVDGIAIAVAYLASPGLGIITAISTLLHEIPHEIGDFGILLKAGWAKRRILITNIVSASFAIFGSLLVFFLHPSPQVQAQLLAATAGIFLYLCAVDFLPQSQKNTNRKQTVSALLLGVFLMLAVIYLVPHH
ncbi:MAG: ZIP family metal transporter [Candidatus Pacebacteria bacterium]|nr:ZIP family metal transporter [Candidatus Paceibacterota bacterium]PIR60387.1 MAG: hypothetical protein COU67_02425 [Candidatus Pacebacteria bacterium CG10_big_fil_rev_8_21_14_0_10_44_54]